jgi:rfaE bifunctional protein nucleotidyltransferase chain/domain
MEKTAEKIVSVAACRHTVDRWKKSGDRVVFTNGCFDIIHLGHVDYLERARYLGSRLIVGLNTDRSVGQFKGPGRPVQNEVSRARVIASFQFVDLVVLFDEETPFQLISAIVPDILVKGSDYLAENIVGADVVKKAGGQVVTLDFVEGYSTSSVIERIRKETK